MRRFVLVIAVLLATFAVFADEPLLKPEPYTARSANGKFFLRCDSDKNTTTCFEKTEKGDKKKWTVQDWQEFEFVSNDGVFCILDETKGLVPTDYNADTILFKVYKNGKLFDTLTVGRVYEKLILITMNETASHYKWGQIENLYGDGILLQTNEGKRWYDFGTKTLGDAQKKIAETAAHRRFLLGLEK